MTQLAWEMLHPRMSMEHLGLIPGWLNDEDLDPASKQIDKNYGHGGGWSPMVPNKWFLATNNCLRYPGDPPLEPRAQTKLRDELIVFYDHAIVAIIQPDRSFEVARID